ncbi:hypothetical protein AALP_AAs57304U000300, partial [Arabis alpina]
MMGQLRNFTGYALCAADEALRDAELLPTEEEDKERTGVSIGGGIGSISDIVEAAQMISDKHFLEVKGRWSLVGKQERWNIDVLLTMLIELFSAIHQKATETCPFSSISKSDESALSVSLLESYVR